MTNVWVLIYDHGYEGQELAGVYSTKENAEKALPSMQARQTYAPIDMEEWPVDPPSALT